MGMLLTSTTGSNSTATASAGNPGGAVGVSCEAQDCIGSVWAISTADPVLIMFRLHMRLLPVQLYRRTCLWYACPRPEIPTGWGGARPAGTGGDQAQLSILVFLIVVIIIMTVWIPPLRGAPASSPVCCHPSFGGGRLLVQAPPFLFWSETVRRVVVE